MGQKKREKEKKGKKSPVFINYLPPPPPLLCVTLGGYVRLVVAQRIYTETCNK